MINTKLLIALAVALLMGVSIGWMIRGDGNNAAGSRGDVAAGGRSSGRDQADGGKAHWQSARRASRPGTARDAESTEPDAGVLEVNPEALAALINAKVVDLERREPLVTRDEPLARLLAMDASEVKSLNDLWQNIRPRLDKLRMEKVKYQRLEDGGVWLGVEPFPEEGDILRQDFIVTSVSVLGESRGRVFLDAIKAHTSYGRWGKSVGTGFTVRMRERDDDSLLYEIIEQSGAGGKAGRRWLTTKIPAHLEAMAKAAGVRLTAE